MNQKIVVRKIQFNEEKEIWKVAKTLSILERYYFYYLTYKPYSVNALVAIYENSIVGCITPHIKTHSGEKIGIIGGIFVDCTVQGKGVGKALANAALSHFQKEGCKINYVLVDRFNSPSWNMFLHNDFTPFEFNEQFRVYGWKTIPLWEVNGYLWEMGCFILRKTDKENQATKEIWEGWHLSLAWISFSFIILLMNVRIGNPLFNYIPFILSVVGVSILAHELSHKFIAHILGLKTVFKIWESGLVLSVLLALFGITVPFYGSSFIKQKDWSYNKNIKKMGLIYSIGPIISLILASLFLGLTHWSNISWIVTLGTIGFHVNFIIVLFNLIPTFPFNMFDGKKIFLWNKIGWILLVMWFILLFAIVKFL
ncbi:MAG: GNAT family N-acetyltransferase [Methanosarcinaceae archaeon]|nr:GNAT family N-acetyltransferase [Methanosarcinaceae archaeon]